MIAFIKEEHWLEIHPALDYTAEHAYIGQKLKHLKETKYHIIIDDGNVIPTQPDDTLEHNHLQLTHPPHMYSETRWTNASIDRFSDLKRHPTQEPIATEKTQLLTEIKDQIKKYIEFQDPRHYSFFSLWTIGTYCFPLFNTYPYVHLTGLMQSGKTKLMSLCSCLSFNAVHSANITTACLYRLIEAARSSLFLDEAETLHDRKNTEEIRSILLSGYKKGGVAFRTEKDNQGNFVPRSYEVYSPKMVANIEGLEAVLATRCITVTMQRGISADIINSEVNVTDEIWQQIRNKIYPFIMVYWKEIKQTYHAFENNIEIKARELELWKPILSIAKFFGNEVFEEMKTLATETAKERNDNFVTYEQILLEALLGLVTADDFYSLKEITAAMSKRLDFNNWLNPKTVAKLLKGLGFNNTKRICSGTQFKLEVAKVNATTKRYGISVDGVDGVDNPGKAKQNAPAEEGI